MKRISNFLFAEQAFSDTSETKPCVIDIDSITCIQAQYINDAQYSVVCVNGKNIVLTGDHEDNLIDFAKCLGDDSENDDDDNINFW